MRINVQVIKKCTPRRVSDNSESKSAVGSLHEDNLVA